MANYNLVVDSKFEPFSFERYIQPYQLYDKAYKEVEKDYTDYVNKVGVWENLINQETEAEAYNQYKTYMNALEENAKLLMQEGLNPTQRDRLLGMKSRYSKEIIPIEQAYAKRAEQIKAQQDLRAKDPSVLLEGEASITSLDDYIKNPQLTYKTHSGAVLEQTASKAAGNLAKELRTNPKKWKSILGDSYYETIMKNGLSSQDILNFMNNPTSSRELDNIYNSVLESSGIKNWANYEDIKDKVDEHITRGFWSAIGTTSFDRLANPFLKDGSGEKEDVSSPLSISYITTGTPTIDTEYSEKAKDLKSLRITDEKRGYSTEKIDNLYKEYNDTLKALGELGTIEELENFENEFNKEKEFNKSMAGNPYKQSYPKSKKQAQYNFLRNKINTIETNLASQVQQYEKYASDWEHLGNTTYERLQRGSQLEERQKNEANRTIIYNAESADHKKVIDGVDSIIRSFRKQDIKGENTGLFKVTEEGKQEKIDYDEIQKILEESHEVVVRITDEPHLAIISNGEEYKIEGSNIISNANNALKAVKSLSDFSKKGLEKFIKGGSISEIGTVTLEHLRGVQPGFEMPMNVLKTLPHGYKGVAFRIEGTNEYVKILTDNQGVVINLNTTTQEIEGKGNNIANIFLDLASKINDNYLNQVAVDYDKRK